MYNSVIMETMSQPIQCYTDSFNFVTSMVPGLNKWLWAMQKWLKTVWHQKETTFLWWQNKIIGLLNLLQLTGIQVWLFVLDLQSEAPKDWCSKRDNTYVCRIFICTYGIKSSAVTCIWITSWFRIKSVVSPRTIPACDGTYHAPVRYILRTTSLFIKTITITLNINIFQTQCRC